MKCASEGTCLVVGLDDGCRMLVVDKSAHPREHVWWGVCSDAVC